MKKAVLVMASLSALLLPAGPVKVIFDTDMYTDFDDAGALACLHALADAGECEILATVASTRGALSVAMCEKEQGGTVALHRVVPVFRGGALRDARNSESFRIDFWGRKCDNVRQSSDWNLLKLQSSRQEHSRGFLMP